MLFKDRFEVGVPLGQSSGKKIFQRQPSGPDMATSSSLSCPSG